MVPVDDIPVMDIYWHFGKAILRIADFVKKHEDIYPIYISNFGCGPDSFISHDFRYQLRGKPFLTLELDEHSADAGLITRCEAFLDSIAGAIPEKKATKPKQVFIKKPAFDRKLYVPGMCDLASLFAGALKHCGLEAEPLPESDELTFCRTPSVDT